MERFAMKGPTNYAYNDDNSIKFLRGNKCVHPRKKRPIPKTIGSLKQDHSMLDMPPAGASRLPGR